jgi:hypothetical protein
LTEKTLGIQTEEIAETGQKQNLERSTPERHEHDVPAADPTLVQPATPTAPEMADPSPGEVLAVEAATVAPDPSDSSVSPEKQREWAAAGS